MVSGVHHATTMTTHDEIQYVSDEAAGSDYKQHLIGCGLDEAT